MNILPVEERLAILRNKDRQRYWQSLDEQRLCMLCQRLITGRDIRITKNGDGQHEVQCATENCAAKPGDWFYFGSAQAPGRPMTQENPQRIEVDLDFS